MQHPFETLKPEYEALLARMVVTRVSAVDATAKRLLTFHAHGNYDEVAEKTGIPIPFMATSFEREASSNFLRSPAQGDRWNAVSVNVPRGRGPFANWVDAALDAYHINGLDAVGKENWTWALCCYYGEVFNGFGYRDYHHEHSPYVWGGSNIQESGKYTSDNRFNATVWDTQLGIIPMMKRMIELEPKLALAGDVAQALSPLPVPKPQPAPAGVGASDGQHDMRWVQHALNGAGFGPIAEDNDYGRHTAIAVRAFQAQHGLDVDGIPGPKTIAALEAAAAAIKS